MSNNFTNVRDAMILTVGRSDFAGKNAPRLYRQAGLLHFITSYAPTVHQYATTFHSTPLLYEVGRCVYDGTQLASVNCPIVRPYLYIS